MKKYNFLNSLNISLVFLICLFGVVYFSFFKNKDLIKNNKDFQAAVAPVAPLPWIEEEKTTPILLEEFSLIKNENKKPEIIRGLYVSSWVAGTSQAISRIINLIDSTSANAIIIDIKDATGRISYMPKDQRLLAIGSGTNRIRDLESLIKKLKEKDIYVIGRISVFQDPFYANIFPDLAYKDTRTGKIWNDNKGLAWLRNDKKEVWEYTVLIAKDAIMQGFDEINLDYVRFPSDGPISYLNKTGMDKSRREVIKDFFEYVDNELRKKNNITISADLFGLTMSSKDDLGIGQVLEDIAPFVDFVSPMVYPSHFAQGSYGIQNPAQNPKEIIFASMSTGIKRIQEIGLDKNILRPWYQDFDLGAVYTKEMVKGQIDTGYDLGLKSWMLWDPQNVYTKSAF